MRKQPVLAAITAGWLSLYSSFPTNAALISRLDGQAYYDTESNLTWVADANLAVNSANTSSGLLTWADAMSWVSQLDIAGVTGWRLPTASQPDPGCSIQNNGASSGYNCTGSEMGFLFYNSLGSTAQSPANTGPFSNIQSRYWTSTDYAPNPVNAWDFDMSTGYQGFRDKRQYRYVWAVKTGDVAAVPLPASIWLMLSGVFGLFALRKHKK